jgi:RHS repeat-associated protein
MSTQRKLTTSGSLQRKSFSARVQTVAITAATFVAFVLPPITNADAATIWSRQAKDFRVTAAAAATARGLDPAYAPPPKSQTGVAPKNTSAKQAPTISTPTSPACVDYTVAGGTAQAAAVQSPGTPMGWGADYLQLAPTTSQFGDLSPRSVPGPSNAIAVSSLAWNTLFLINGTVWGYGLNGSGQLGVGDTTAHNVATQAVGLNGVVAISAGSIHSLAIKSDGTLWAWGDDTYGELGIPPPLGPNNRSLVPLKVPFSFPAPIVEISAGAGTSLAVDANGTLWWWGTTNGGVASVNATPTAISFPGNPKIVLITQSPWDAAMAVDLSGNVWIWGLSYPGNGTSTNNSSPAIVPGISGIAAIAAGSDFSLAADNSGHVWAWGDNSAGQLGIGNTTSPQLSPVQVLTIGGPVALAAGDAHAFALFSSGALYGWGSSSNGQVGTGFVTDYTTPQFISITVAQPVACAGGPPTGSGPNPGPTAPETNGGPPSDEKPVSCDGGSDPVNCVTGNFWHQVTDLVIPGRGFNIDFQRTYNSLLAIQNQNGRLGFGWMDCYNASVSFDGSGNPTVHEENGGTLPFSVSGSSYSAPTRVLASLVKNANGSLTLTRRDKSQLIFSSAGQLQQQIDHSGYVTTLTYTGSQLTGVTDSAGRKLTLAYNGSGQLASLIDPANRSVLYTYDASGNLQSVTDLNGGITKYSYDTSHDLLTITDPRNAVLTNVFDTAGRVIQQTDQLNRVTKYAYGPNSTTITYPDGSQSLETYQNNGLTGRVDGFGTGLATYTAYTYDSVSMSIASFTDALGAQTVLSWDSAGNLLKATDPNLLSTSFTYNTFNAPLTGIDALNVQTTSTYDPFGNLTSTSTPLVGTGSASLTSYVYDTNHPGDLIQVTDPDGKVWKYAYDTYGNRVKSIDPLGNTTTSVFDIVGRMTSSVSPNGNVTGGNPSQYTTSYTYDGYGDGLTTTDPMGNVTTNVYDGNRNRTSVTDANHHATTYTFDLVNELTQVTRPDGSTSKTAYDLNGNVASQTDGLNNSTTYSYDTIGRMTSMTDALGRTTTYGYGSSGYASSVLDPSNRITSYAYDAGGRLTSVIYSDAKTPNVALAYDARDERTSMSDGTGMSTFTYDSLHRLTKAVNGANVAVSYAYDLNGQLTSVTYPGGTNSVKRSYDAAGRLAGITDWNNNLTSFTYDANSNLVKWTYPNSTVANWSYDRSNSLTAIKDTTGSKGTVFLNLAYTRDGNHQLTGENNQVFAYDNVNRLSSAAPTAFTYDNADQLTQMTVTGGNTSTLAYDSGNQLGTYTIMNGSTQVQKYTYSFDSQGNRIKRVDQSNSVLNLSYDQANRLTGYGSNATYAYNGDGLRMSKTVAGTKSQSTWDVAEGTALLLGDGTTSYVTGPGGMPLEQVVGKSTYYYYTDQLGSVRATADSRGTSVNTYAYDVYGNLSSSTGTVANPFRYAGQYFDTESGFYYLRARYYDPSTEQFVTKDPLAGGTRQPYIYASDTPLNMSDPAGLEACCAGPAHINIPINFKGLLRQIQCHAGIIADGIVNAVQQIIDYVKENGFSGVKTLATRASRLVGALNWFTAIWGAQQLCGDINEYWARTNCEISYTAYHTIIADILMFAGTAAIFALFTAAVPEGGEVIGLVVGVIASSLIAALIADYASHAVHDYEKNLGG